MNAALRKLIDNVVNTPDRDDLPPLIEARLMEFIAWLDQCRQALDDACMSDSPSAAMLQLRAELNEEDEEDEVCGLYDSETNDALSYDDLGITLEEYEAAIRESVECGQPEGHIYIGERRVYAAE